MTERERREQGLPPSPAQVALYTSIQREAEERITVMAGPALKSVTALAESVQPALRSMQLLAEPVIHAHTQMADAMSHFNELHARIHQMSIALARPSIPTEVFEKPEPIAYIPARAQRSVVVHVEMTGQHCELIGESVATALFNRGAVVHVYSTTAQIDIQYDGQRRSVSRMVSTAQRTATFTGTEDNKRRELFERLIRAKRPIDGPELKEYLGCRSMDATYKVVQGLNNKLRDELGLTVNFADGSDRGGYHVHSTVAVHET